MSFSSKVAVVTGAGSGIGRSLALGLADRGARLALSDIDEAGLAATAELLAARGTEVHTQRLDVGDRDAWTPYADAVIERFGVAHQIYNNAGIAFSRTVLDSDLESYERVLQINLFGVIYGTKAFLPHLIASGAGHVVNVSSLNGIMAQPELSHYCTAKFGVRGFTETLRGEMRASGTAVGVTVVHPGGIKTAISSNALASAKARGEEVTAADEARNRLYQEKLLKMDPDQAAKVILDGVAKDRPRVLVGNDAKALDLVVRLTPSHAGRLVAAATARLLR